MKGNGGTNSVCRLGKEVYSIDLGEGLLCSHAQAHRLGVGRHNPKELVPTALVDLLKK